MSVGICSRICKSWCVLLVWFLYSYCYWVLYDWEVMTAQYSAWKSDISVMQMLILVSMGLVQMTCSKYADFFSISVLLPTCVILGSLPLLFFEYSLTGLMIVQTVHGCAVALIVPVSCKFYARMFRDEDLNLVFCFLKLSSTCAKVILRIVNICGFKNLEPVHVIRLVSWVSVALLSFLILLLIERNETRRKVPVFNYTFKELLGRPWVHKLALSFTLLKFTERLVTSEIARKYVLHSSRVSDDSADVLVGVSGFLGGLILTYVFSGNQVVHYFFTMHLLCYTMIATCAIFVEMNLVDSGIIILVLGFYFNTTEIFISGSAAVRLGEQNDNCGAAVCGIVNGFGNLGQAIAILVLYVSEDFSIDIMGIVSGVFYTFSLYNLQSFTTRTESSSSSHIL